LKKIQLWNAYESKKILFNFLLDSQEIWWEELEWEE
jgi:hypothetical protein